MPLLLNKGILLCLLAVLYFASCKKEMSCENCRDRFGFGLNNAPVANAGPDQTITLTTNSFNLDGGSSTDRDNNITKYEWINISGPSVVKIANANAVQTSVNNFMEGVYQFELKVTDATGLFSKDTVLVTVKANSTDGQWTRLANLPEIDFVFGSNHINFLLGIQDKMFAASKTGRFFQYDPQKKEWKAIGDLPNNMINSNFSVVFSVDNKGYIIGNGVSRQYDALTGKWVIKNNVPVGTEHVDYSVPLVIGNKVYMVGSTNNLVTLYDPAMDTYTAKNKFPDVGAAAGFVLNGIGYCVQQDGHCWKYDPATDSWQQKASMPPSIFYMSSFSLNGYGYIIGDLNHNANNGNGRLKVWRYNPFSDQWKQLDEDYPGEGTYAIKTVSLNGVAYAGLGYNIAGDDVRDFWSFK